jgi:hypothetical protein
MNVNSKNNCHLKLTDYEALTIRKHKVFETDGSENEETEVLFITQHKINIFIPQNEAMKAQNHHNKTLAVVPK